jgi:hypothetical protein
MSNNVSLEQRILNLEQTVDDLQQKIDGQNASANWLNHLIGSVSDEDAFLTALEYGRTFRQSDRRL